MTASILGIDTDKDGGLCLLSPQGRVIRTWSAPTRSGEWRDDDARSMFGEAVDLAPDGIHAVIEEPTIVWVQVKRPRKRGLGKNKSVMWSRAEPKATRKLALLAGRYMGICCGLSIPYEVVEARTWQGAVLKGAPGASTKEQSLWMAKHSAPGINLSPGRRRTEQHGIADAFCMAEWFRRRELCGGE